MQQYNNYDDTHNIINDIHTIIPGGAHTYSKGADQFPQNCPKVFQRGEDCYLYDTLGKQYLDWGMGLRSVTIGYNHPDINVGAKLGMERGNNLTLPSTLEYEAAKLFCKTVGTDMVKFAKNGSNVTTAAVKLARAYTNKSYVLCCNQPFFSFDDWFIGTTEINKGIPLCNYSLTKRFNYNDLDGLTDLFNELNNDVACVIMEPITSEYPKKYDDNTTFLEKVRQLCTERGTVLIFDEMILGFRYSMQGAGRSLGVHADLLTFGKGIANGFSVAALTGKREIMNLCGINEEGKERVFLLSSTHGAEMSSMGALIQTINFYKSRNVIAHIWHIGSMFINELNNIAQECKVNEYFKVEGTPCSPVYITLNKNKERCLKFKTLFMQEMVKYDIIIPYIAPCYAHMEYDVSRTCSAAKKAFHIYKQALEDEDGVDKYLCGPSIKPVFRKYN